MKTGSVHELLIITSTNISTKKLSGNQVNNHIYSNVKHQLQEAYKKGLIAEVLPEIITKSDRSNHLFITRLQEGCSFLWIELSGQPAKPGRLCTMNPNFFAPSIHEN